MPPEPLFDLSTVDTSHVEVDREGIGEVNPHRYEFQQLDGIFFLDREGWRIAGFRDVRDDEFWVRGHIPGRPIFPGVLMIEAAAQLISYCAGQRYPDRGFMGFGGVDKVKFRGQVIPGQRIILIARMEEFRSRRCSGAAQGFVDGQMVFEGVLSGLWV